MRKANSAAVLKIRSVWFQHRELIAHRLISEAFHQETAHDPQYCKRSTVKLIHPGEVLGHSHVYLNIKISMEHFVFC